eukprot:Hpha_TRINITY_DN323_c0_g1::TRINITY_DN323_c0_g1_i1::g.112635::m.112635
MEAAAAAGAVRGSTSVRACELLASMDAVKRQKVLNEKMRNELLDSEDLLQKLHAQSASVKQRLELDRAHARGGELLHEFEGQLSFSHLRRFNVSKYMVDCAQEMQVKDLHHPDMQPDVDAVREASTVFQALRGRGPGGEAFVGAIDQSVRLLAKVVLLLEGSKLKGGQWADLTRLFTNLLERVMDLPPVSHCLHGLDEQCRRLEFAVTEVDEQMKEAVDQGEMAETEKLYYKKVTLQEALADTVAKKFDTITEEQDVAVHHPLEETRALHREHQRAVQRMIDETESLKKRCEADLRRLNDEVERVNVEDYEKTKHYAAAVENTSALLKQNLLAQDSCWTEIEGLERKLVQFGNERTELITRRIKDVEDNEARRVEYQHFMSFALQHKKLLELTIHNCEIAEEATDVIDEIVSTGCNAVEARMREVERELEDLRLGAHEHYLTHFRSMYLTLGDLRYKKQANIEALDEKMQVAHMQQEMYMESLNPKAKEYSQLKKDIGKLKEDLQSQVGQIQQKEVLYVEAFKPTERALIAAGREFLHPVEELQQLNQRRKDKLVAYHKLVTGDEEGDASLEIERQQIERDRLLLTATGTSGDALVAP